MDTGRTSLSEDERRKIAAASRDLVNNRVLRELSRLVRAWQQEEQAKKRVAIAVLCLLAVALVAAGLWATTWRGG